VSGVAPFPVRHSLSRDLDRYGHVRGAVGSRPIGATAPGHPRAFAPNYGAHRIRLRDPEEAIPAL
jgi:hypothetical protein